MGKKSKKLRKKARAVTPEASASAGLPVLPSSQPPSFRPLLVDESDVRLLLEVLETVVPDHRLVDDLKTVQQLFRNTARHVAELAKVAIANGFWEEEKSANDMVKRVGRGSKLLQEEARRQLQELAASPEEVRQLIEQEVTRRKAAAAEQKVKRGGIGT